MLLGDTVAFSSAIHLADEAVKNPLVIQRVADYFNTLGIPKSVVEYGHPVMMGVMVLAMGFGGGLTGWAGRLNSDKRRGAQQKSLHANIMGAFTLLALLGGSGGLLSVAMQGFPVGQSTHAITAVVVLALLMVNGTIAGTGFGAGGKRGKEATDAIRQGRQVHAYLGAAILAALAVHAAFGMQILLGG